MKKQAITAQNKKPASKTEKVQLTLASLKPVPADRLADIYGGLTFEA